MATQSNILAWESPWTEDLAGYSLWGCKESQGRRELNTTSHKHKVVYSFCNTNLNISVFLPAEPQGKP